MKYWILLALLINLLGCSNLELAFSPGILAPPRGKRHDYFTSALPWTQKGPGVSIGLAGTATLVDPSPVSGYFVQQSNNNLGAAQLSKDGGVHDVFTGGLNCSAFES
jgi:hypothetical protein